MSVPPARSELRTVRSSACESAAAAVLLLLLLRCKAGSFVSWWQCVSRNEVAGSLAEGEDLAKFAQLDGKATTANTNVPHAECSDPC